ncbi:type I glyceraldehyde-3-phosphate dehydrogenase [Candidatus Falkowbacteria bacterium]|nr:type I glyceraldehyde-3-phosphate dehydrogenase [Candidatus Falkowbacteria bacterium]
MVQKVRVAINGFGRIGRAAFKIALDNKKVEVVAINDLVAPSVLAYLLKYDSVYNTYDKKVTADSKHVIVNGKKYPVFQEREPKRLPWKKLGVDVVLECTGFFLDTAGAGQHLRAGAKKVVISAPGKDDVANTHVFGTLETQKHVKHGQVVSNASCTTNCISPVMQVLATVFGIEKAMMTTAHAYTASQGLVDEPNSKDMREGRAAAMNLVPTHTGAAEATAKVVPALQGKFTGISIRVPVICGSLSDVTCVLKKNVTAEQVNNAFRRAAKQPLFKNILEVSDAPLVSSDIIGNPHSAIVDTTFTRVVDGNLVKVLAWYDNEWGYAHRLVEMAVAVS